METNWNQLIERYLNGELSAEGKAAFEQQLQESPELQKELELHQLTQNLIKRAAIRNMVRKSGKRFQLRKKILNTSVVVIVATALATAAYFIATHSSDPKTEQSSETVDQTLLEETNKELAFNNIDPQFFKFTGQDDVFLSESGVLLSMTDHSFLLNGKPYTGEAVVQWQEAQTAADIVKAGLSTKSGDKLLETQGMFSLNAFTPDGKKLELSDEGVYVQVPVDEFKKDMMLFNGVKGKDGNIDWQKPEELERLPKPKSMKDMDLFPPKYEPKLNELKWFTDKEKRDSLYLSFDETMEVTVGEPVKDTFVAPSEVRSTDPFFNTSTTQPKTKNVPENIKASTVSEDKTKDFGEGELLFISKCSTCHNIHGDGTGPDLFGVRERWEKGGAKPGSIYKWVANYADAASIDEYATLIEQSRPAKMSAFPELKGKQQLIDAIFDYIDSQPYPKTSDAGKKHIPPSKVLAIWDKKFDNTILATQDFEDRMKAIHNTCDERVFDIYAKNLNEPLWKLDEKVVKLGYKEFQQFANQRVGSMKLDDAHQKNLQAFYDKAIKEIRSKGKEAMLSALKKEQDWDNDLGKERSDEVMRKGLRESANLNEEYGFNLRNVYKQLGITVAFQMHGGGTIVNIDKYVWDATVARQSTLITEPSTGKTAQITYNPMKLEVSEPGKYDKLYVYLFSKEINSYQRLDLENGKLDYNLNGDMNYTAAIFGMNEDGYFIREISPLKDGDLGKFSLKQVNEADFEKTVNALNNKRTDKPMSLDNELKWLFKEQANYKVQKKRRENAEFRAIIRPTIYSCGTEYAYAEQ